MMFQPRERRQARREQSAPQYRRAMGSILHLLAETRGHRPTWRRWLIRLRRMCSRLAIVWR